MHSKYMHAAFVCPLLARLREWRCQGSMAHA